MSMLKRWVDLSTKLKIRYLLERGKGKGRGPLPQSIPHWQFGRLMYVLFVCPGKVEVKLRAYAVASRGPGKGKISRGISANS